MGDVILTLVGLIGIFSFGFICKVLWENLTTLIQDRGRSFDFKDWCFGLGWMLISFSLGCLAVFCILMGLGVL